MRETGRSRSGGHPANRHSGCVPFKTSRSELQPGRAGSWRAHCNASWEMEFALGVPCRKEPIENYKSRRAARGSRAAPPLGWAPALLPPLAKLRWPPVEGRLQSEGRRWVRRGRGRGAQRQPVRGRGPTWHLSYYERSSYLSEPRHSHPCNGDGNARGCGGGGDNWGEGAELVEGVWMDGEGWKSPDKEGRDCGRSLVGGARRGGVSR